MSKGTTTLSSAADCIKHMCGNAPSSLARTRRDRGSREQSSVDCFARTHWQLDTKILDRLVNVNR